MGSSFPKPALGETPKDWMQRCGLTYYVVPYLDNLGGWTEANPQIPPYPRSGTFDPGYLASAHRMIYEGQGDPDWDYPYMRESYEKWYGMKEVWDQLKKIYTPGPVLKAIPKPRSKTKTPYCTSSNSLPDSPIGPPPYTDEGKKTLPTSTSFNPQPAPVPSLYPSLAEMRISVEPGADTGTEKKKASVKSTSSKKNSRGSGKNGAAENDDDEEEEGDDDWDNPDDVGPDGGSRPPPPVNTACVWVAKRNGVDITPPSPSALRDIISLLPSPDKPLLFVDMLVKASRNCQLTGADYRFILQSKLGDMYDEERLLEAVQVLSTDNDKVINLEEITEPEVREGERKKKVRRVISTFFWKDNEGALDRLRKELTAYLLSLKQANRDLSQVTNCKQERNESTSVFWNRFCEVWQHLGGLDLNRDGANPLFLSTFLVNCRPEIQGVLKHHWSDRNNLTVRAAGEKLHTLEGDGLLDVKINKACLSVAPHQVSDQRRGGGRREGPAGGQIRRKKGRCHYCGKEGHWIRECHKKQRDEQGRDRGAVEGSRGLQYQEQVVEPYRGPPNGGQAPYQSRQ